MRYFNFSFLIVLVTYSALVANTQIPDKALCSVCALKADPVAYLPPVFPRPAPASVVEVLQGGDKALGDFKGQVVLLDFWATWCKPCLKTMPRLQKLYDAHSEKGFEVLGVSIDEDKDRLKKIKKMVAKIAISYPIFIDAKQTPAWYQFKVKALPAMYLLDGESQIVAQWTGKIDYREVEKEVLKHLDKRVEPEGP